MRCKVNDLSGKWKLSVDRQLIGTGQVPVVIMLALLRASLLF